MYVKDSSVTEHHARYILTELGLAEDFVEGADYFVSEDEDGEEYLTAWGYDEPFARNTSTHTWLEGY